MRNGDVTRPWWLVGRKKSWVGVAAAYGVASLGVIEWAEAVASEETLGALAIGLAAGYPIVILLWRVLRAEPWCADDRPASASADRRGNGRE